MEEEGGAEKMPHLETSKLHAQGGAVGGEGGSAIATGLGSSFANGLAGQPGPGSPDRSPAPFCCPIQPGEGAGSQPDAGADQRGLEIFPRAHAQLGDMLQAPWHYPGNRVDQRRPCAWVGVGSPCRPPPVQTGPPHFPFFTTHFSSSYQPLPGSKGGLQGSLGTTFPWCRG